MIPWLGRALQRRGIDHKLLGQSATAFGTRVAGLILAFFANILMSRAMGASGFGAFAIALGWASILAILVRCGFDNSSLRFMSVYRDQTKAPLLNAFFKFALFAITGAWAACTIVVSLVWLLHPPLVRAVSTPMLAWALLLSLLIALTGFLSPVLRVMGRVFESQAYEQLLRPLLLALAVIGCTAAEWKLQAEGAMVASVVALGLPAAMMLWRAHRLVGETAPATVERSERKAWLSVSSVLLGMALMQEALNQVELILLGLFSDTRQAALFAAAQRLSSLSSFGLVAIATVSGPRIAAAFERADYAELASVARLTARLGSLFAIAVIATLLLIGPWLLSLFGPEFIEATPVLHVLLLGAMFNAVTGLVGYLLVLTGHERTAMGIMALSLASVVGTELLLIPRFGAVGAAWGSVVGIILWNGIMTLVVRRLLGIDATALGLKPRVLTGP